MHDIDVSAVRAMVSRLVDEALPGAPPTATAEPKSAAPAASAGGSIALGADHGGYRLKLRLAEHLRAAGHTVVDCGANSEDPVDYPDIAQAVADQVASGGCVAGIVVDGAGIGSCMAANKVPGVRAALCYDLSTAQNARDHNHANVLTLGAGMIGEALAKQIVDRFLATPFGPERHARRVAKITSLERRYCPPTSATATTPVPR